MILLKGTPLALNILRRMTECSWQLQWRLNNFHWMTLDLTFSGLDNNKLPYNLKGQTVPWVWSSVQFDVHSLSESDEIFNNSAVETDVTCKPLKLTKLMMPKRRLEYIFIEMGTKEIILRIYIDNMVQVYIYLVFELSIEFYGHIVFFQRVFVFQYQCCSCWYHFLYLLHRPEELINLLCTFHFVY